MPEQNAPPGIAGHEPDASERRFWKLYREERRKLVLARQPGHKRPFSVRLTSAETVHAARSARKRMDAR